MNMTDTDLIFVPLSCISRVHSIVHTFTHTAHTHTVQLNIAHILGPNSCSVLRGSWPFHCMEPWHFIRRPWLHITIVNGQATTHEPRSSCVMPSINFAVKFLHRFQFRSIYCISNWYPATILQFQGQAYELQDKVRALRVYEEESHFVSYGDAVQKPDRNARTNSKYLWL